MKDLEIIGTKEFISTPNSLTNREKEIYERIVSSYSPDHFTLGEIDLLKNYCMNFILLEEYNKQLRLLKILSKEHKQVLSMVTSLNGTQGTLSQKLRINPSSRVKTNQTRTLEGKRSEDDEFGELV